MTMEIKIVLSAGKREISLTLDEAREMREALDQAFGAKPIPVIPVSPAPMPVVRPVLIPSPVWPYPSWRPGEVICQSISGDAISMN